MEEYEFFFYCGNAIIRYVCLGMYYDDAKLTALDAMRGSYFKLREGYVWYR